MLDTVLGQAVALGPLLQCATIRPMAPAVLGPAFESRFNWSLHGWTVVTPSKPPAAHNVLRDSINSAGFVLPCRGRLPVPLPSCMPLLCSLQGLFLRQAQGVPNLKFFSDDQLRKDPRANVPPPGTPANVTPPATPASVPHLGTPANATRSTAHSTDHHAGWV